MRRRTRTERDRAQTQEAGHEKVLVFDLPQSFEFGNGIAYRAGAAERLQVEPPQHSGFRSQVVTSVATLA